MKATIEDVARLANVSTATVSRALRGLPNVAPSTRARIQQVATELGYAIDPYASRLASGQKMMIAMILPLADQWFYSKIATSAEAILAGEGYDVLRYSVFELKHRAEYLAQLSRARRVDGIIVGSMPLTPGEIKTLNSGHVPVVTVETLTKYFPSVSINNRAASFHATEYLIGLGHERIATISGQRDNDAFSFNIPTERLQGFLAALAKHHLQADPEHNVPGNFSYDGGAEAMSKILSARNPPTAVFAFSDEMAIGALKCAHDLGIRVPEDISIMGFDNNDVSKFIGLTTVHQPVGTYGEIAAQLLLESMQDEAPKKPHHVILETDLIIRDTTAPHR